MANEPLRIYKPIYKRWWFWAVVVLLAALSVYAKGYFIWKGDTAFDGIENITSGQYWQYLSNQSAALEKAYREDTYGGDTPEATLRMFVEALEKKDFELAAKYFIPEERSAFLQRAEEGQVSGAFSDLIDTYKNGETKVIFSKAKDFADVDVIRTNENIGFFFRVILNPFTNKWKIKEY